MVDPHTVATFAFAQIRRDPNFGRRFSWVRNTVVCVESDLVDDVLNGQMAHYFGDQVATIACYYPDEKRFMFAQVGERVRPKGGEPPRKPTPGVRQMKDSRENPVTVGELLDTMYGRKRGDNSGLPVWDGDGFRESSEQPFVGEASTAEIEKKLALT
jgi:hypothetical protein